MRIAYVSTYPPIECGIATYTDFLVQAMARTPNELHVISQNGAMGKHVHGVYDPESGSIAHSIFNMTVKFTPDIIHIQHEFGLYGEFDGIAVLDLIYRFKSTKTPVVVTFHTVIPEPDYRKKMIVEIMCRELDAIIVHESSHVDLLKKVYGADGSKICLIPHGARKMTPVQDAKTKLNLENKKVILLVGYFRPSKCFDRVVDIFPRILEKCPEAWLVVSGKMRGLEYSEYRNTLFQKIADSSAQDRIEVFRGQFPQNTFDTIISASDVMVFPYSAGAQSGVMAHAFAFGKPVVTSDLPAFKNAMRESNCGFSVATDEEYVDRISELLNDKELYDRCSANATKYVQEEISWDIIARKTLEVYKRFDVNYPRSRYIYEG
jgi:glycosyltransferase involved in cell wall biosynthesis